MPQVIIMFNRVIKVTTTDRKPQLGPRETLVDLGAVRPTLEVFKALNVDKSLRDATRIEVQEAGLDEDIVANGRVGGESVI